MSNWNKIFKPIVVLCVICIVVTGALAATNSVTAPIIEAATLAAQEAARTELLPDAQGFEKVEGIDVANVSDVYRTTNDVGVVITSSAKGYGGDVVVMTAITPDGTSSRSRSLSSPRPRASAATWCPPPPIGSGMRACPPARRWS